jgi:hypothetical protein
VEATLGLIRDSLAARAAAAPRLEEHRRTHVIQEAIRRRAARKTVWRFAARIAAGLILSAGLTALLLPRLHRPQPVARNRPAFDQSDALLVRVSPPAPPTGRAAPPPPAAESPRLEHAATPPPVPAAEMPLGLVRDRASAGLEETTREARSQVARAERVTGPTYIPPSPLASAQDEASGARADNAPAREAAVPPTETPTLLAKSDTAKRTLAEPPAAREALAPERARIAAAQPTPESAGRGQTPASFAMATPAAPTADATRRDTDASEPAMPVPPKPAVKPKPPAPPQPRVVPLPGLASDTTAFAAAREALARGEWPPANQVRVEQFLAALDFGRPAPTRQPLAIHAEAAASPFRPGLHLLALDLLACATNAADSLAAREVRVHIQMNPARVKRLRLLGYDHQPLRDRIPPDLIVEAGDVPTGRGATLLLELELQGDSALPLGTVLVHYRGDTNTPPAETTVALDRTLLRSDPARATPGFRLAAATAEFAERLRAGPDEARTLDPVIRLLQRAALEFSLNPAVRDLARMAESARTAVKP